MQRRKFVVTAGALAAASSLPGWTRALKHNESTRWDYVIVGAGTAGLPAAIFASRRGARVLLIDAADDVGGNLHLANGQISAAGTRTQDAKGIKDTPDDHYADIVRLSHGLADSACCAANRR